MGQEQLVHFLSDILLLLLLFLFFRRRCRPSLPHFGTGEGDGGGGRHIFILAKAHFLPPRREKWEEEEKKKATRSEIELRHSTFSKRFRRKNCRERLRRDQKKEK
jgi:hypothetical protein